MTTYRNPWHKPETPIYGPAQYTTNAKPVEHAGCTIYERIPGHVWDVVRGGVCRTQMAGLNGAKAAAEKIDAWARGQVTQPWFGALVEAA
jgi:hypothetical protein